MGADQLRCERTAESDGAVARHECRVYARTRDGDAAAGTASNARRRAPVDARERNGRLAAARESTISARQSTTAWISIQIRDDRRRAARHLLTTKARRKSKSTKKNSLGFSPDWPSRYPIATR